jgi:hypothetical protein
MKFIAAMIFMTVVLALCVGTASAQKRTYPKPKVVTTNTLPGKKTTKKPTRTSATKTTGTTAATTSITTASSQKVSNQITNVTRFLYLLGGIAKGIEDIDKDAKANRQAREKNEENKKTVQQTIRNLRAGLLALETEFQTTPALRPYLLKIQGISKLASQSESLAMENRFMDSGKPLVSVVEKLADTLAEMP